MGKFDSFNINSTTYNTVRLHNVDLSILTPKAPSSTAKRPVIVSFHAGGLVLGSRLFEDWTSQWLLDLVVAKSAIMVTPDYRLLPEATGLEILEDLSAFWKWIDNSLASYMSSQGVEVDSKNILVVGGSAGGYFAAQSALLHPSPSVKAVISMYGMLDLRSRWYTESFEKHLMGMPKADREVIDKHLQNTQKGTVVTEGRLEDRSTLAMCMYEHGRFPEFLGSDTTLYPMENLDRAGKLPPIWLVHGKGDTMVPVEDSVLFEKKVKQLQPKAEIKLTLEEGEHGLDEDSSLQTPWLAAGIDFISKFWD